MLGLISLQMRRQIPFLQISRSGLEVGLGTLLRLNQMDPQSFASLSPSGVL